MKDYLKFALVWALNSIILIVANSYYPKLYVLGNAVMTPMMAGLLSGLLLTLLLKLARAFSKKFAKERLHLFLYYFLANSVGIWIIARLSVISGFGVPAFYYAFYLGAVASVAQWLLRQVYKKTSLLKG